MLEETWGRWSHHFHNQEVAIINAGSPFIFFHFLLFFIHSVTSARAIMLPIFRVINLIQLNICRLSLINTVRGEYLRQFWIPTSWQPNYHFNIDSWSICVSSIYIFIICLSFIFLSSFLSSSFFLFFLLSSFARSVFFSCTSFLCLDNYLLIYHYVILAYLFTDLDILKEGNICVIKIHLKELSDKIHFSKHYH